MYAFAPLQIYVTSRIAFFSLFPSTLSHTSIQFKLSQVLACTAPRSPMVLWHRTFKFAHCTGKETRCQTRPHHPGAFLSETRSVGLGLGSVCSVFYPSILSLPFRHSYPQLVSQLSSQRVSVHAPSIQPHHGLLLHAPHWY